MPAGLRTVCVACDKRVPIGQGAAFMQAAVGTGGRHPMGIAVNVFGCQYDATCNHLFAQRVVAARATGVVKQATSDVRVADFERVFVFEFQQTAFAASIAQRFPLWLGHVGQIGRAPKVFAQALSVNVLAHGVVVERLGAIV